jgi:ferredoxin
MSKKDGKSNLIGSKDKKGFWTIKVSDDELDMNERAAASCPVKVIEVRGVV